MTTLNLETLDGIYYRSSQGGIDPDDFPAAARRHWEQTHGYTASLDALINTLRCAENLDPGCTQNDIRCRFIINEGKPSEIRLPECLFYKLRDLIEENLLQHSVN